MSGLHAWQVLAAFALDWLIGDPRWLPHPVVAMGKLTEGVERFIRPLYNRLLTRGWRPDATGRALGLAFPIVVVGASFALPYLLLEWLAQVNPLLAWAAEVWLIATTVAARGLTEAGWAIFRELSQNDLTRARKLLSQVVGRDTDRLDAREVTRGAVETVAENIVDAVAAPILFALIGGAPLAMAYRAVNTLDSMVGYKDERYQYLGWASARLDDLCNWVPARLAFLALVAAAWLLRKDAASAWRIGMRDARKHPSPNSGWTESAVAGALGIQLGGTNYYRGIPSHRPRLGDPIRPLVATHVRDVVYLHVGTAVLYVCAGALLCFLAG